MDGRHPCWWHPADDDDTAAATATAGNDDDLFELVRQAKGGGAAAMVPSLLRSPSCQLAAPPSEDVMAAWLYPIVGGHAGDAPVVAKETRKGMLRTKDTNTTRNDDSSESKACGSSRKKVPSSHHSGTHNLAEKKRRCRIKERFRTLQQLVPGCDKSNQASTLEQTIQYMKSLQQQLQAMNTTRTTAPPPPAALYNVAVPMPGTVTPSAQMVPFVAMLPYPQYPAAAAAGAPWYAHAQAGAAPGAPADHTRCSVSMEKINISTRGKKGGRRM